MRRHEKEGKTGNDTRDQIRGGGDEMGRDGRTYGRVVDLPGLAPVLRRREVGVAVLQ